MAEIVATGVFEATISAVGKLLHSKTSSKEEFEALKKNVREMVKLSQNTSYAVERYITVTRSAVRAGVAVTELRKLFDSDIHVSQLINGISSAFDNRVVRELQKDSLQKIHEFREDYDHLNSMITESEENLSVCIDKLRHDSREEARERISVAEKKLDEVVIFIGNRIDQMLKPLSRSFEILVKENS